VEFNDVTYKTKNGAVTFRTNSITDSSGTREAVWATYRTVGRDFPASVYVPEASAKYAQLVEDFFKDGV
jgi:hypothetical protein